MPSPSASVISILCRLRQQVWLLCRAVSIINLTALLGCVLQQVWLLCYVVSISKCVFYSMPSPSANVSSMLCRLYQQGWLLCCASLSASTTLDKKKEPSSRFAARRTLFHVWYHARSGATSAGQQSRTVADRTCPPLIAADRAWYHTWNSVLLAANLEDGSFFLSRVVWLLCSAVSISKCDFCAMPSLSASMTSMLCVSISKYNFYAVRLYQQVWLLCCAVSISKCDFYAVSSPSASVTSVVSSSSSNVTSRLCRLHQQVWLLCRFVCVAGVTSMLCRVRQQVWLVCHFVCVSKRDFCAVLCSSANVSSMLCHLRQQAFMPDVRGCRQVNVIV